MESSGKYAVGDTGVNNNISRLYIKIDLIIVHIYLLQLDDAKLPQ